MKQHKKYFNFVSRNINHDFDNSLTFGQRLADRVASFGGSWFFICIFGTALMGWIILNSLVLQRRHEAFDPYPYILLNLILSTLAAFQAPFIMMSQNRQNTRDRLDAAHDYEVNIKAEEEICELKQKLDELTEMNQETTRLLKQLLAERT